MPCLREQGASWPSYGIIMTGTTIFRQKGDIVIRDIAGECLLIPIRGRLLDMQRIYALNPVAQFVWAQLDGQRDINALAAAVEDEFETTLTTAVTDIQTLCADLLRLDLIEEVVSGEHAG
jgi:hypothetical protein